MTGATVLESLPGEPLQERHLDQIEAADAVDGVTPVTWRGLQVEVDPPHHVRNGAVQVTIVLPDDRAYALTYLPSEADETGSWVVTDSGELLEDGDDDETRDAFVRSLGLGEHGEQLRDVYGDALLGLADDARGWGDAE